jgi:hypothetical protein
MDGSKPAYSFVLAGKVNDPIFHKCLACLRHLEKERPKEVKLEVLQFFETQWEEYLKSVQIEKKGPFFNHKSSSPLVYYNDVVYVGDGETFLEWALNEFRYQDNANLIYKKKASDAYKALIDNTPGRNYAYLDVNIKGDVQKVIIELFTEYAPKTCTNFLKMCTGGAVNAAGEKLSYVNTDFHRIVRGMYVQAGDLHKAGVSKVFLTVKYL